MPDALISNISSDVKRAYSSDMRKTLNENPALIETFDIFDSPKKAAKSVIRYKMNVFNSIGKARFYFNR